MEKNLRFVSDSVIAMPSTDKITSWGVGPKFTAISLVILVTVVLINHFFLAAFSYPFNVFTFSSGAALIIIGVAVCFKAAVQVHQAFNAGKLVTTGIYAHVRNPVYAVFILLVAPGLILVTGLLLLIVLPCVLYALIRVLIVEEDVFLENKFGQEYLDYKKKVNSIIPFSLRRIERE